MGILKIAARVEQAVSRLLRQVFGGDERHFIEVRRAILDEVESRVQPMGDGVREFPFNHLVVSLLERNDDRRYFYESAFIDGGRLKVEIIKRLGQSGVRLPPRLDLDFNFVTEAATGWRSPDFHVEYKRSAARRARPLARLTVLKGDAERGAYVIDKRDFNIGRTVEALDKGGHIERRNDLVFIDNDTPVNRSVSRMHAHLWYDEQAGAYRLCDDNSARGTSIFREGKQTDVPRNNPRGLQLRSGDEIFFGEAHVRWELMPAGEVDATPDQPPPQSPPSPAGHSPAPPSAQGQGAQQGRPRTPEGKTYRS